MSAYKNLEMDGWKEWISGKDNGSHIPVKIYVFSAHFSSEELEIFDKTWDNTRQLGWTHIKIWRWNKCMR